MSVIKVSIVSSNEEIFSGEATMVFATGSLGELGIAPGHTPLLTGLAPGPVRVQNNSDEDYTQLRFNYGKDSRSGKKGYIPDWSSIPVGFVTYNPLTNLAYKRISRDTNTAQDYIPLNPKTLQPLE